MTCIEQDPGDGFYRRRPAATDLITDPVQLIGTSVPCQCHGPSAACDRDTGKCEVSRIQDMNLQT